MKSITNKAMYPPEIYYYTSKEVIEQMKEDSIFRFVVNVCTLLSIDVPNIAIGNIMSSINPDTGEISARMATTWTPEDLPALDMPLIYIGVAYPNGKPLKDKVLLSGVVAHEIRHLWQKKYHESDYAKIAKGFIDSLDNPAEIDADAFAIAYVSNGANMVEVAQHICKNEFETYPCALDVRLKKANEILSDIKRSAEPTGKESIRERILSFFRRK